MFTTQIRYEHSIWCSKAIQIRGENVETINSFHPVWGATSAMSKAKCRSIFQSTLPVGGATSFPDTSGEAVSISIHAPRGGSDWGIKIIKSISSLFQSTLPVGGATCCRQLPSTAPPISIHAPRGGSDLSANRRRPGE